MVVCTNGRELVSAVNIRNLNQLSWDKKLYANFQFADGSVGLEVNYWFGDSEYCYKVVCRDEAEMHLLRVELDVNSKLVRLHDGRLVSCSK